jgi:predicted ATP-grasp superfamily ATP-dependent carboligase
VRVFVCEYLCSGAAGSPPGADSLCAEGWGMLSAVLEDLSRCQGVYVLALVDPRLHPAVRRLSDRIAIHAGSPDREEDLFRTLAGRSQGSLIIAPEFDDLLYTRCSWVEQASGRLLGPSAQAVRLTGDKLALARHLSEHRIPTPPAVPLTDTHPPFPFPLVCKPRQGAGSQATFLVRDEEAYHSCQDRAAEAGWTGEMIVQPYVPGLTASVAFLAGSGRFVALPAAEQILSRDGRFRYRGGRLPLAPELQRRAHSLAGRTARAVPGLAGYFGIDLILGESRDGSADMVMEINPRLTTSYIGLRGLARGNLAQALLDVASGREPVLEYCTDEIRFGV